MPWIARKTLRKRSAIRKETIYFSVKGNQGKLYRAIKATFPVKRINDPDLESFVTEEKSPGRKETRLHVVM